MLILLDTVLTLDVDICLFIDGFLNKLGLCSIGVGVGESAVLSADPPSLGPPPPSDDGFVVS